MVKERNVGVIVGEQVISELVDEIKRDEQVLIRLVEDTWGETLKRVGQNTYRCFCHFHDDRNTPNFTVYRKKDGYWGYRCFACDASGDAIEFVQKTHNYSFIEAVKYIAEVYGFDFPDDFSPSQRGRYSGKKSGRIYQRSEEGLEANLNKLWEKCRSAWKRENEIVKRTKDFLESRGIKLIPEDYCGVLLPEFVAGNDELSTWLREKAQAGYNLVVPVFRDGNVVNLVLRDVVGDKPKSRKVLNLPGKSVYPVNLDGVKKDAKSLCILCEGITDFLSVVAALRKGNLAERVVAVTGANIFKEEWAKEFPEHTIIIYDGDQAGYKGAQRAFRKLKEAGKRPKVVFLPAGVDLNDLLLQSGSLKEFLRLLNRLLRSATDVPIRSIRAGLQEFLTQPSEPAFHVGFLSEVTVIDGLPSGLFVLGGVPGIGKTALAIELALETARYHPVLFFEQELSSKEIYARFISRLASQKGCKLSWAKVYKKDLSEDEKMTVEQAVKENEELLSRVFHYDSVGNVKDIIAQISDFIEITGEKPVVFIDYLQVLEPDKKMSTRREEIARIANLLSQTAATFEIPIVLITSVSRQAYWASNYVAVMAAGKEAGEIEYAASGLLVLRFFVPEVEYRRSGKKVKPEEVIDLVMTQKLRPIELVVPKIRAGIPTTKYLLFDGETMSFELVDISSAISVLKGILEENNIDAEMDILEQTFSEQPAPARRSTREQSLSSDDSNEENEEFEF
jgi:KaiC/GvpD/RAD55 family RecA-like ATPase